MQKLRRLFFSRAGLVAVLLAASWGCSREKEEPPPAGKPAGARKLVVGYAPNWVDMERLADAVEWGRLTHVNVAFANPVDDEGAMSLEPKSAVLVKKAHAAGAKALLSIGGGSASEDKELMARYALLTSAERRAGFAGQLAAHVADHGFDGLDVDLEGPSVTGDYGPFIEALAAVLKPKGRLLTAAVSEGYGGKKIPDAVLPLFDFLNIMAYDGAGYWNPEEPGQHSSMEMAKQAVSHWCGRGLAKEKVVLGVPFYGYGFGPAFKKRDYPYKDIVAKFPGAELVDETGDRIWYNGIPTIKAKAQLVVDQRLGGVMIWSLDCDAAGEKSLLRAIDEVVR